MSSLIEKHREQIRRLAALHGARNVRVFGSVARGDASDTSDVDLLVALDPGRSLIDLVAFKQDIEDILGRQVDVVTESSLDPYIRDSVLNQAVVL